MRYVILILVIIALVFSYYVWGPKARLARSGQNKNVSSGVITYGNETLANLHSNGFVTLNGTFIRNALVVNGKLEAQDAHLGSMKVNGMAEVTNSIVDGTTEVRGYLYAKNSTFQKKIQVASQKISLDGCTLESLVIPDVSWTFGTQVVELSNKTICKGPITFESGKGKVLLSADSQILGQVTGAEVENQ